MICGLRCSRMLAGWLAAEGGRLKGSFPGASGPRPHYRPPWETLTKSALPAAVDAEDPFHAAMVWAVRPGDGRSALETPLLRQLAGINLDFEGVPHETTILKFRHLLERHELSKSLFDEMTAVLTERGLLLRQGTIADATLIAAPPSTRNAARAVLRHRNRYP